jgi:hypothetical protein
MTDINSSWNGRNYPNNDGWAADSDEVLTMLQKDGTASTIDAQLEIQNSSGNWRPHPDANSAITGEWGYNAAGGSGMRLRIAITTVTGAYNFGRHGKTL